MRPGHVLTENPDPWTPPPTWAEELTELTSPEAVSDALYEQARQRLEEVELVDLTMLMVAINGFNRINIAARTIGGSYKPGAH